MEVPQDQENQADDEDIDDIDGERELSIMNEYSAGQSKVSLKKKYGMSLPRVLTAAADKQMEDADKRFFNPFEKAQTGETVDINELYTEYYETLEAWYRNKTDEVKAAVMLGRNFNDAIKETRKLGMNFMEFEGFTINVNENPDFIGLGDLTRARFMALIHYFLYLKQKSAMKEDIFYISPLVHKVSFEKGNPLNVYRYALGGGFQYLGKALVKTTADRVTFFIGCAVLDYLSAQSTKNPQYEAVVKLGTFSRYVRSEELAKGGTFIAALRNMNAVDMSDFNTPATLKLFWDKCDLVKFDMSKGGAQMKISAAWKSILRVNS